jgi:transposase
MRACARSDGGHHRYAGCESDRKKGASIDPVGYDAGKKTKGIKRNAIVDTEGHLLSIEVIAANTQDRDCAADLIKEALRKYPRLRKLFADGGYAGGRTRGTAGRTRDRQAHGQGRGFKVIRRRGVIERTFSWLRRNRRLMAHYEALFMTAVRRQARDDETPLASGSDARSVLQTPRPSTPSQPNDPISRGSRDSGFVQ